MNLLILLTINAGILVLVIAIRNILLAKKEKSAGSRNASEPKPREIVSTSSEKAAAETSNRTSSYSELLKWLIGTVGLGLVGIMINKQIQQTDLSIKRIEADAKLLEVITKDKDILKTSSSDSLELRYLQFIRTFITTDSIKKAVDYRKDELARLIQFQANNAAVHLTKEESNNAKVKLKQIQRDQLDDAYTRLLGKNIADLKKEEQTIAPDITPVDSSALSSLNVAQKNLAPPVIIHNDTSYILVGNPTTKWCKTNYYVEFNNLRILVKDVSPGNQTMEVNLLDLEENADNPRLIQSDITVTVGETYTVYSLKTRTRYQITLTYIGSAGRNPFTKAAYITVAIYQKG